MKNLNGDFYFCETCKEYWPSLHPESSSWFQHHRTCTLPEYTDWDNRLALFEERTPVGLMTGNEIPDDYECALHPLELLAYGGTVTSDLALELFVSLEPAPAQVPELTDEQKDAQLGAYTWCTVCKLYTLMRAQDSFKFRAKHGSCRSWGRVEEMLNDPAQRQAQEPEPSPIQQPIAVLGGLRMQEGKGSYALVYGTPKNVVQYGNEAPDGYASDCNPLEELAFAASFGVE
jgi:hypothetical protein